MLLIHRKGQKRQEKKFFFLNGVSVRPFATPISANMMPSFRKSRRGHEKFKYPHKKYKEKHQKIQNIENTKKNLLNSSPRAHFQHSGELPGAKVHAEHDGNSEIITSSE